MHAMRNVRHCLVLIVIIVLSSFKAADGLTIQCYKSSDVFVLGNTPFTLSCEYNIGTPETLNSIILSRKRSHGVFHSIVKFNESSGTVSDEALKFRTTITSPTPSSSKVSVKFADTMCTDEGSYKWLAVYVSNGPILTATATIDVHVKAETTFDESVPPLIVPNSNLEEGDEVTFACEGDVGKLPVGKITFLLKYKQQDAVWTSMASEERTTNPIYQESTCSYRQTATLKMKLSREMNGMVVRCAVYQDTVDELGDKRRDTAPINVQFPPVNLTVFSSTEENNNRTTLALVCNSDSNPAPTYRWLIHHDKTTVDGSLLRIPNVTTSDSGKTYTCYVSNTINGQSYEINKSFHLNVPGQPAPPGQPGSINASPSMSTPAVVALLSVLMVTKFVVLL